MAEKIATREAYGKALAALAEKYPDLGLLRRRPRRRDHDEVFQGRLPGTLF